MINRQDHIRDNMVITGKGSESRIRSHIVELVIIINIYFILFQFRSGRGKDERSRWDTNDHEHGRVRHNSGSHSQPAIPPHLPGTPQRMPPNYDGRDRTMYSAGDADRWRGER